MLKNLDLVKNVEAAAGEALSSFLRELPFVTVVKLKSNGVLEGLADEFDLLAEIEVSGRQYKLICEVKSSGQPRHVRFGLLHLQNIRVHYREDVIPVFIAPYLSPEAREMCRQYGVGYLDFEGNTFLQFENIYIDRQTADTPRAEKRELKSIFRPKSAQILKILLKCPEREWRVTELAEQARVSVGHVSNVRTALLDREWAELADGGFCLSDPNALLDEWRNSYGPPAGEPRTFYTTFHGRDFQEEILCLLKELRGHAAFASFSAAQWLSAYARTGTHYFYADEEGFEKLQTSLKLGQVPKGHNVSITVVTDSGLLFDTEEPIEGAVCTSAIQTYLDLSIAGERGREAADYLRETKLNWSI